MKRPDGLTISGPILNAELVPHDWSTPDARRLLSASVGCGVFGGMGTWNDGPAPVCSERLFWAMLTGFVTALNT